MTVHTLFFVAAGIFLGSIGVYLLCLRFAKKGPWFLGFFAFGCVVMGMIAVGAMLGIAFSVLHDPALADRMLFSDGAAYPASFVFCMQKPKSV